MQADRSRSRDRPRHRVSRSRSRSRSKSRDSRSRDRKDRRRDRSNSPRRSDERDHRRRDRDREVPAAPMPSLHFDRYDEPNRGHPPVDDSGLARLKREISPSRIARERERDIDTVPLSLFSRAPEPEVTAKRPNFIYSEKAEQRRRMQALEREIPTHYYRDMDAGYYSVRTFDHGYMSRMCPIDHWSVRCPEGKNNFYDEWSPMLMRRVQDKFNFKLEHIKWLQKLLLEAKVPLGRPVAMVHLQSMENEVEMAVLVELVDEILMPNRELSKPRFDVYPNYIQALSTNAYYVRREQIEIFKYLEDLMTPPPASPPPPVVPQNTYGDEFDYIREIPAERPSLLPSFENTLSATSRAESLLAALPQGADTAQIIERLRSLQRDAEPEPEPEEPPKKEPTPPPEVVKEVEKEKEEEPNGGQENEERNSKIEALITQILSTARRQDERNPVLDLLLSFKKAQVVLYQLATRQPQTLILLANVIKNPKLTVPESTLEALSAKLKQLAADADSDSRESSKSKVPASPAPEKSLKRSRSRSRGRRASRDRDRKRSRSRDRSRRSRSKGRSRRSRSRDRAERSKRPRSKERSGRSSKKEESKSSKTKEESTKKEEKLPAPVPLFSKKVEEPPPLFSQKHEAEEDDAPSVFDMMSKPKDKPTASTLADPLKNAKFNEIMARVESLRREAFKKREEIGAPADSTSDIKLPDEPPPKVTRMEEPATPTVSMAAPEPVAVPVSSVSQQLTSLMPPIPPVGPPPGGPPMPSFFPPPGHGPRPFMGGGPPPMGFGPPGMLPPGHPMFWQGYGPPF